MFDHIIGNEAAKAYLRRTAQKRTVGNSLLFAGPDGVGKSLFAEAFAKLLICQEDPDHIHRDKLESGNHPDIRIYRPEGKVGMHSIASMRQFSQDVYLAPAESKWKVFIIQDADRMLPYSANALLKTFEEPAADAIIILLSSSPSALLPTVLSRCRTVYFHPLSESEVVNYLTHNCAKTTEEAQQIAAMAQGSIGQAVRLSNEGDHPLRKVVLDLLAKRGGIIYKQVAETASAIAEHIEATKKEIEKDIRKTLMQSLPEDLTAVQKQSVEKEVEGAVAMHASQEAEALFRVILGWYRDLHLLHAMGNPGYLQHRDYSEVYGRVLQYGHLPSLEDVQESVSEASLSLERSTSMNICFENLFLKLGL